VAPDRVVCDVAEFVAIEPHIAWNEVQARACKAGAARMVRLGLRLAADLLGTSLPASVDRWTTVDPAAVSLTFGIRQR